MSDSQLMQLLLAAAVTLDLIAGEYPNSVHPVLWMGNFISYLWEKRYSSSTKTLLGWGIFLTLSGIFIFSLLSYFLGNLFSGFIRLIITVLLLKPTFAMKALLKASNEVKEALIQGDLEEARRLTAYHLVSRDTSQLTEEEICGAVIESVAENITDGFISPIFYYALGGLPAAWTYRFVNTCDSMIGYRKEDYEWGGKFAALLDDVLNWIPARMGAVCIVLATMFWDKNWRNSWKTMRSQNKKTSSPNAGWTMSAMAGALGVTLEKNEEYSLVGGEGKLESHLIESANKIALTAMIGATLFSIILMEVIH